MQSRTCSKALPLDDEILNHTGLDTLTLFTKIPHPFRKKEKKKDSAIRMKPSTLVTAESIT